ncbi:glycerate kinase family protein [Phreatobacter sp.]|uniref:glycerate kinase family protein n=1 Tax=Phreatobacter sp. TaxID=1966341 RepID=UPI003F6F2675
MVPLRVVVAPSGFKECLGAEAVTRAIARGILSACPTADVVEVPLIDGGEGFARALVGMTAGTLRSSQVDGPLGSPVEAVWGFVGGTDQRTAVIDMASAAGLSLVPRDRRDPLSTCTFGVGQLIRAALDAGARHIIVGCGDSGTNDAGAGMAAALGVRLLDRRGQPIRRGAQGLLDLADIDMTGLDPRIAETLIEVSCNLDNLLLGPRGVARIYGPQKGAPADAVGHLEIGLGRFAAVARQALGIDLAALAGAGASGGLGAGLAAFLGARLVSRYDILSRFLDIDRHIEGADLVFTAEGGLDAGSAAGKIPGEVGRRARSMGIPVIALVGTIGAEAEIVRDHGIGAYFTTVQAPCALDEAMAGAEDQIERCADNVMRTVMMAFQVAASATARSKASAGRLAAGPAQ